MSNINQSKQVSFEIADMVTIPRNEYEYLKARSHALDDIVMALLDSQKALNSKIKGISRRCKEVF